MDSSFKKKMLISKQTLSQQIPFKKGFEKHSIISQKRSEISSNLYSTQKKTIKKLPKIHTPCTKQANTITLTQSCSKMSSNHQKKLNFDQEEITPKRYSNSPNDRFLNGFKTLLRPNAEKMQIENDEKTVHTEKKSSLIVRKLDFIVPRENSLEEEGVYCLKISKENEGNNRNIIKAEIKIEINKPENEFFYAKPSEISTENISKVTLNTFNSFRLSSENKLIDMMDAQAHIDFQRQALEEIHRKFAQKDFSSMMRDEKKTEEIGKKICCNCKKSRCLKLYCECFAAQKFCQDCNCLNCANLENNCEERKKVIGTLLVRNPHAFKPKLEYEESQYISSQIAVKHTKGCNCKKTLCSKKYCECYQAGIKCTELCKCEDCRNCEFLDHNQLKHAKNFIYYQMKRESEALNELSEGQNVVRLEKNNNLFKGFVGVKENNNNKIKMNLFNCLNEKKEDNRFFREKTSPFSQIKLEEMI